jgi:ATP-binding cassette subfamily F protein 3
MKILDYMETDAPLSLIPKLRDMLGAFLFRGDDVYKNVSVLSGGEKSRLALLKMFLKPMNLLILDEPTNHLDLHSKDILLNALSKFGGAVIFVSHDRYFMEALSTKTLEITPSSGAEASKAKLFYGNYSYYLEKTGMEQTLESKDLFQDNRMRIVNSNDGMNNEQRRAKDKEKQAVIRRLEKQESEILKTLEELEKEKNRLENELALPDVYSIGEKAKEIKFKIDEKTAAIEEKTSEWETVSAELNEYKK